MDRKLTGVVAYLTWAGLLIAYLAGDREGAKFHLNQALVIWLAGTVFGIATGILSALAAIPFLGWVFSVLIGGLISLVGGIFFFVCWLMGLIYAIQEQEKEVPLLGKIRLLK